MSAPLGPLSAAAPCVHSLICPLWTSAIAVAAVSGAPGNGGAVLADATRAALAAAGFEVAAAAPGALRLVGDVAVHARGARRVLVVAWRLAGADGTEIGAFEQSGPVPGSGLDGAWGALADAIARGAAEGVALLLADDGL